MAEKKLQPIIVKRVKKAHHAVHGGAWKIAYADFVTAMMAFFIVMWILGQSDEVKQAVQDYANDPLAYSVFTGERKSGTIPIDLNLADPKSGRKQDSKSDQIMKLDKNAVDTILKRVYQKDTIKQKLP